MSDSHPVDVVNGASAHRHNRSKPLVEMCRHIASVSKTVETARPRSDGVARPAARTPPSGATGGGVPSGA